MKINLTTIATSIMLALWAPLAIAQSASTTSDLRVKDAWVRATSSVGSSVAIYFTLTNTGQKTLDLTGVRADIASIETLHKTEEGTTGTTWMSAMPDLRVAPGKTVKLEPGGPHVMLIDLEAPLIEGKTFPLHLSFYDGDDLTIEIPVLGADATGPATPDTATPNPAKPAPTPTPTPTPAN